MQTLMWPITCRLSHTRFPVSPDKWKLRNGNEIQHEFSYIIDWSHKIVINYLTGSTNWPIIDKATTYSCLFLLIEDRVYETHEPFIQHLIHRLCLHICWKEPFTKFSRVVSMLSILSAVNQQLSQLIYLYRTRFLAVNKQLRGFLNIKYLNNLQKKFNGWVSD